MFLQGKGSAPRVIAPITYWSLRYVVQIEFDLAREVVACDPHGAICRSGETQQEFAVQCHAGNLAQLVVHVCAQRANAVRTAHDAHLIP
jgi:hypothetical protein